jgi:hypothetical protein
MANATPYDVRVWIYPGAPPSGSPTTWGLPLDISAYVRYPGDDGGQVISYTVGRGDEASQVDASTMTLTLDNRTGIFSTKNVASSLYGKLSRNTPIVVGMTTNKDTFTRTTTGGATGTSDTGSIYAHGTGWGCNGSSLVWTGTGANTASAAVPLNTGSTDWDMTFTVTIPQLSTGAGVVGAAIQNAGNATSLIFKASFNVSGQLQIQMQRTGVNGGLSDSVFTTYTAGSTWNIHCQRTGQDVRMNVWPSATAEPSTWALTWTDNYTPPADVGVYGWQVAGNTNSSPLVVFDNLTQVSLEFIGNVVQWPNRWNKAATNSWTPIQAAGVLRRLQQGKGPIRSPLSRQLGAYGPTGWWTLEDAAGATQFASQTVGAQPAFYTGVLPAGDNTLPGSGPCPTLSATNGVIRGKTNNRLPVTGVTGFSAMFFTKFAGGFPTVKTKVATIGTSGRAASFVFSFDGTGTTIDVLDADGAVISTQTSLASPQDLSQWMAWQLETDISGSNVTWSFISHQVGQSTYYSQTGSYTNSFTPVPVSALSFALGGSNLPVGTAFSQVWLGPNTLPFVDDTFSLVSAGYAGETAGARLARLCKEEGIPFNLEQGTTDPVGVQPQTNILQALRLAADADMGILYESGAGLGYRPRSARYQQAVGMALTVAAGQIDEPPEPTDDDQRYRNKWTITNDGGSYAVAQSDSEINAQGLYEDSATLTLYSDDYAAYHAGFRLYLGTWPDLRWPGLSLNFGRNPALVPLWRKASYGFRMTVATGLLQVQGSDPDVIVEGYTASLWPHGWTAALNCSTAKAWDIATLDDSLLRMDADNSTVATALGTTTGTSLVVSNNGDAGSTWAPTSQLPAEVPFPILVNGEMMTVTNVGDLSGNNQTLTVTRGINGGAKTHAVGEPVRLAYPMIIAL